MMHGSGEAGKGKKRKAAEREYSDEDGGSNDGLVGEHTGDKTTQGLESTATSAEKGHPGSLLSCVCCLFRSFDIFNSPAKTMPSLLHFACFFTLQTKPHSETHPALYLHMLL